MARFTPQQRQNQRRAMARRLAMQGLYQWQLNEQSAGQLCRQLEDDIDFPKADPDYLCRLIRGVIADHEILDSHVAPLIVRGIETVDPVALAILRIAVWELINEPALPYPVIINEAVSLAKKFGPTDVWKMINGVVDKLAPPLRPGEKRMARER